MRGGILLTSGKHLHGSIISLREEVRTHKTSLTPTLFTGVSLPSQEVSILPISTIFSIGFWTDQFRQCGIVWFFALLYNNLKVSGVYEDNLSTYRYIYSVEEVQG